MRHYLYLWHTPRTRQLVASGIEFRDLVPALVDRSLVLLRHESDEPSFDRASRFDFVRPDGLRRLAADNVYDYGDFCWADFAPDTSLADLSDRAIAELTFFGHMARPQRNVGVAGLGNRFLYWAHDDGWYARIFYRCWETLAAILRPLLKALLDEPQAQRTLDRVRRGQAFWCRRDSVISCEPTEDIDALQREYLPAPRRSPGRSTVLR